MWSLTPARAALIISQLALCKVHFAEANNNGNNPNSDNICVEADGSGSGFLLASPGTSTVIYTDPASPATIHYAAAAFAHDLGCVVSGSKITVANASSIDDLGSGVSDGSNLIFFGALNSGSLISQVVNATSMDVSATRDQWESWTIQQGQLAQIGGNEVAIVAGADRRGAAYAAYTLSEESGVSPWYWWADVPIVTHSSLRLKNTGTCNHASPVVQYRGIFLNDEQPSLTQWANKQFNAGLNDALGQSFLPAMYEKMFELILRLKGNMIWPAMWADMFAVAGLDGLPNNGTSGAGAAGPNQLLADAMGVIYGTSHQEPMARNTPEWSKYGKGEWNYTVNQEFLDGFWTYGAERAKGLETLITVGMRGDGDLPLPGASIERLKKIIDDQRQIISKANDGMSPEKVPQVFALYKEVAQYWEQGLEIPEDVTLLWSDDNWGNIRRVALANETERSGGAAQYYHLDYVGDPRSYKWISTVSYVKMWEQLNTAQHMGTSRLLILNVGDLKPIEVGTTLGLALAYEGTKSLAPTNGTVTGVSDWVRKWARRTFPTLPADKVAHVVEGYSALNARIKPELVNSTSWSLIQFDEAERVEAEWQIIVDMVEEMKVQVDETLYPAFYQLVAYPALASANLNQLYLAVGRSNLHATQARTSANLWADKAQECFARDEELSAGYHQLLDYKWDGMMSQTHIGYQYWQQPMRNQLNPGPASLQRDYWPVQSLGPMRITKPELRGAWPGDNGNNCALGYNCPPPTLSGLGRYSTRPQWIDVSSGGWIDFEYTATANASWISLSSQGGMIAGDGSSDARVHVSIDWTQVPANASDTVYGGIMFASKPNDHPQTVVNVTVIADTRQVDTSSARPGAFVGEASYVAMHATNATVKHNVDGAEWVELPYYGLTGNALVDLPPTHPFYAAGEGPSLEFDFYSWGNSQETLNVTAFFGPFENYHAGNPFQYALSMDGSEPTIVQPIPLAKNAGAEPGDWNEVVASSIRKSKTTFNGTEYASAGWHTLKLWNMIPGMVLEEVVVGGDYPLTSLPPPQSCRL